MSPEEMRCAVQWSWSWLPHATHTHFGDNPVFDVIRLACLVAGVVLLFVIGRVLAESRRRVQPMPLTQHARFWALALAVVYVCVTEFAVFGTPATPRLPVGVVMLALGIYGVAGMRSRQRSTPPVR